MEPTKDNLRKSILDILVKAEAIFPDTYADVIMSLFTGVVEHQSKEQPTGETVLNPTTQIVRKAMEMTEHEVREPKCVRDGLVVKPTGETVYRKVSVKESPPLEDKMYHAFDEKGNEICCNRVFMESNPQRVTGYLVKESIINNSPVCTCSSINSTNITQRMACPAHYHIPLPTQSVKSGEELLNKLYKELEEKAYDSEYHNYNYKLTNQILRTYFESLHSICLNKEEIIKWIDEKGKWVGDEYYITLKELRAFILSLPSPPPAQREERETVIENGCQHDYRQVCLICGTAK